MSLENIFGAVVLLAVGLVILLHPDKFRYSSKQIKQFIFRYWWISVFVLLGYLTMGEWEHLIITQESHSNVMKEWFEETTITIINDSYNKHCRR